MGALLFILSLSLSTLSPLSSSLTLPSSLFRYTNLVLAMKIYESRKTKFFRMNSTQRLETIEGIREAAVRLLLLLDPAMEKVEWYLPAVIPSDRSDKTIGTQDMSDWLGKLGETVYQSLLVALNQDGVGVYGRTKDYWPDRLNLVIDLLKRIDEAIYSKRNVQTREVFDYASHVRMVVLLLSGGVAVMEEVQSDDIWKSYIRLDEEVYNVNRQHTGCKMNPSQDGCGEIMLQRPIII